MSLAVVKIAGKQFLVRPGDKITVNGNLGEAGKSLTFSEVLLTQEDAKISVGTPLVDKATVRAKVVTSGKGPKLLVRKFKAKSRYRRKIGFRPNETVLEIVSLKTS